MRVRLLLLLLWGLLACNPPPSDDDTAADDDAGDDDVLDDDDAGDDDSGDDDDATLSPEQIHGQDLYMVFCSYCHGNDGEGYLADEAPALSNESFLQTATDDFLKDAIDHGRPGTVMSAWGWDYAGPIVPPDVADMVAFMRSWQSGPSLDVHDLVVTGQPEVGAPLYVEHCEECHGIDGIDGTSIDLANPWLLHTASDGFLRHAIATGRPDTEMEPWGQTLSVGDIDDLVALLRSWATPVEDTEVPPFEPDLSQPIVNEGGPPADFSDDIIEGMYIPVEAIWQAYDAGQSMVLLDSRPGSDYMIGHISGAVSAAFYRVDEAVAYMPEDLWLVAYCGCPHSLSGEVASAMIESGFNTAGVLDEGWYAWLLAGYPMTVGTSQW